MLQILLLVLQCITVGVGVIGRLNISGSMALTPVTYDGCVFYVAYLSGAKTEARAAVERD
jgi:hypothetical protein